MYLGGTNGGVEEAPNTALECTRCERLVGCSSPKSSGIARFWLR